MPQLVTLALIFLVVLALAGLILWLVRRFSGNRLSSNANRGRMPRLAVIDAATVDARGAALSWCAATTSSTC